MPGYWWDMPSNRHNQGASFSFADGHVEHWRWVAPMIYTSGYTDNNRMRKRFRQRKCYTRIGNAMRIKPSMGCAD
jgi:prepilin-type processing-associated H-X9-DG protein